jgi:hypothetical protein
MIIVPGAMPSRDANGRALPAKFRFYQPDTTTPAIVYTDNTLGVALPFPILSDSAGRWPPMWASEGATFDVGWSDQVYDQTIEVFTGVSPADDAVLASVDMAQASADEAAASAAAAEASAEVAAAAASGLLLKATSSTPNTISAGPFPYPLTWSLNQTGTDFFVGQDIEAADLSNAAANRVAGVITSFVDPVMTASIKAAVGSGSHAAWSIGPGSFGGVVSVAGLTGIITADALKDAIDFDDSVADAAIALALAL